MRHLRARAVGAPPVAAGLELCAALVRRFADNRALLVPSC